MVRTSLVKVFYLIVGNVISHLPAIRRVIPPSLGNAYSDIRQQWIGWVSDPCGSCTVQAQELLNLFLKNPALLRADISRNHSYGWGLANELAHYFDRQL